MKTIYKFLLITSVVLCSCKVDDPTAFNSGDGYIYFDMPFKIDEFGRPMTERLDTLEYSFAFDGDEVTEHTFKIPVNVAGFATDSDREYKVMFDEKSSTVTDSDWERKPIENPTVKSGSVFDTLYIKVKRSAALKTEKKKISIYLVANENFELGDTTLLKANLMFSEILMVPKWWDPNSRWSFAKFFGDFGKEKYIKWQEIYYLGADSNKDDNGNLYYWGNMPSTASSGSYPITFMYMRMLREYFVNNEVYPDGDRTKPRVSLPNNF